MSYRGDSAICTTRFDRREVLRAILATFGSATVLPLRRAIAAGVDPRTGPQNVIFSYAQRQLVDALCERIIPTTDTPGARDAGVTGYIEMMIDHYYEPSERATILGDLRAVDTYATESHSARFVNLGPEQQDAVISLALRRRLPGVSHTFFDTIKQLTVTGYYTSEIGMTVERVYLPVPGRYDGAYPFAKIGRLFAV